MNKARFLLIALLGLLAPAGHASDLRLAWDYLGPPSNITFRLYASTNAITATNYQSATVALNIGTNRTVRLTDPRAGRWWFGCTALADGIVESDLSNVLLVEVPVGPTNLLTVIVQQGLTVTNFQDVGFFRLRLP